ncbi:uncharacterized protein [Littorina saxatilis]|uniref:uncharacterized protein isoform X2 n=1 Tax=Littorina saxatilis TaxID=31220 RepID=UPI0038B5598E
MTLKALTSLLLLAVVMVTLIDYAQATYGKRYGGYRKGYPIYKIHYASRAPNYGSRYNKGSHSYTYGYKPNYNQDYDPDVTYVKNYYVNGYAAGSVYNDDYKGYNYMQGNGYNRNRYYGHDDDDHVHIIGGNNGLKLLGGGLGGGLGNLVGFNGLTGLGQGQNNLLSGALANAGLGTGLGTGLGNLGGLGTGVGTLGTTGLGGLGGYGTGVGTLGTGLGGLGAGVLGTGGLAGAGGGVDALGTTGLLGGNSFYTGTNLLG